MKEIIIERLNCYRPLKFKGCEIGRWESSIFGFFVLYKTDGGNFICQKTLDVPGKHNNAVSCFSEQEVIDFFGWGENAIELYKKVGFSEFETVP